MKKLWVILPLMLLAMMTFALGIGCTYTTSTDGTDYYGVTSTAYNSTNSTLGVDVLYTGLTSMTPRLNFTSTVNDTAAGGNTGTNTTLHWLTPINFSTSLTVKNGSTTVDPSNYTLIHPGAATNVWALQWNVNTYNTTTLSVSFTRNWTKNVDDLVSNASGIYTGASTSNFLTLVTPSTYNTQGQFKLNSASYGAYLESQNWAVNWGLTTRACVGTSTDATTGISATRATLFAAFGLLAVLLLVMICWGVIALIQGGNVDFTMLAVMAIGGAIVLMMAYIIISYVASALGA